MMKKLSWIAVLPVLLPLASMMPSGTARPATDPAAPVAPAAAGLVVAAPTTVSLAWTSDGDVRVGWAESAPAADTVVLVIPGERRTVGTTAAGDADELIVPLGLIPKNRTLHFDVTNAGGTTSSVPFDSTIAGAELDTVVVQADTTVRMTWHRSIPADATPGDPLDKPPVAAPYRAYPAASPGTPTGATSFVTPPMPKASKVRVDTTNEWGTESSTGDVYRTRATATVPTVATYGVTMTVTGLVTLAKSDCSRILLLLECVERFDQEAAGRRVDLQARRDANAAWATVNTTFTDGTGAFRTTAGSPGSRQFRVVIPAYADWVVARQPLVGTTRTTTVGTRVVTAQFTDPGVTPGVPVTARLVVQPPGSQVATLQRRSGTSTWTSIKQVPLTRGAGSAVFNAPAARGTTYYRFVVPSSTYAGYAVAGATSGTFALVVR